LFLIAVWILLKQQTHYSYVPFTDAKNAYFVG
jgi:hypothetical protein